MQQIFETFKMCDIFGQQIRLKASGQSVFQTQIGALMTLLLFGVLIYSGSLFILEMNKGKNAIINSQDAVLGTNQGYSFNSTEFIFSAGLLDYYGQPIPNQDNRIFKITFYICNKSLNQTICNFIPGRVCGESIRKASNLLNIAQAYENITYCPSEEYYQKNPEIRFQGSIRDDNFTFLGAVVEKCSNSTEISKCASKEEIDNYIMNANLYYSYSFHQLNKELDISPYQKAENVDLTSLYYKVGKYIKIYFQYSQSYLEYNPFYFFPQSVYHEGVEYQKTTTDSILYFQNDAILARIEVNLDPKKKVNFITYQTLMDVIAKLGGLFTIIRALLDILIFPIQSILYRLFLINFLINNQDNTNKKDVQIQNSKKKSIKIYQLLTSSDLRDFFYQKSQLINEYLDVRKILIHPLLFHQKIESLQDSIKKIDIFSFRQMKVINKQEMDELEIQGNDDEPRDYKNLSQWTINSEYKIGNQDQTIIPKMKIQIR